MQSRPVPPPDLNQPNVYEALAEETDTMKPEDDDASPSMVKMMVAQAVTNQKVEELKGLVNDMRQEVRDLKSTFATKADLQALAEEVRGLKGWNSWLVKSIVGLILAAVVGGIILKGGVPR